MGNCLESFRIRNGEIGAMTDVGEVESSKDFYSVYVEDVLLKNPHECMEKMEKELKGKRKEAKRVRFSEEVNGDVINFKAEIAREMSTFTTTPSATTGNENQSDPCNGVEGLIKVRIVLRKEEAAALITLLKSGGGKTMEDLIGELARFSTSDSYYETQEDDVDNCWKPVLASIREHEAILLDEYVFTACETNHVPLQS